MKLYPYIPGSRGAKALAQALNIKRIRHHGKPLKLRKHVLINWGASGIKRELLPPIERILNVPEAVAKAANKLETFKALSAAELSIPEWTTDPAVARKWYDEDVVVVARTKLNGHSGEGIVLSTDVNGEEAWDAINAPLYTKYVPKTHEYRIHVFQGDAFFIQRKARKKDVPDDQVNWKVRNHSNGFIYAHQDVDVGAEAKQLAVDSVNALGLDFGAVDMIYNKKQDKYYVLEVNTACGLEGTTLDKYVEKFQQLV